VGGGPPLLGRGGGGGERGGGGRPAVPRGGGRAARRGALVPVPAAGDPRRGGARLAAAGRPAPCRREVRRPADPPVKKLVLAVIDAMKPAMLERAVATGRAPTPQALMERGQTVR